MSDDKAVSTDVLFETTEDVHNHIETGIYEIDGYSPAMLDSDVAVLYGVSTSAMNAKVRKNIELFNNDAFFQPTEEEFNNFVVNNQQVIKNKNHVTKSNVLVPCFYSKFGINLLSTVLRSSVAVDRRILIMKAFVVSQEQQAASNTENQALKSYITEGMQSLLNTKQSVISELETEIEALHDIISQKSKDIIDMKQRLSLNNDRTSQKLTNQEEHREAFMFADNHISLYLQEFTSLPDYLKMHKFYHVDPPKKKFYKCLVDLGYLELDQYYQKGLPLANTSPTQHAIDQGWFVSSLDGTYITQKGIRELSGQIRLQLLHNSQYRRAPQH